MHSRALSRTPLDWAQVKELAARGIRSLGVACTNNDAGGWIFMARTRAPLNCGHSEGCSLWLLSAHLRGTPRPRAQGILTFTDPTRMDSRDMVSRVLKARVDSPQMAVQSWF